MTPNSDAQLSPNVAYYRDTLTQPPHPTPPQPCSALPLQPGVDRPNSMVKPIKGRILHFNVPHEPITRWRRFSPSSLHPINLTQPCTSPSIHQVQPIHCPIALTPLAGRCIRWCRNIPRLLRDEKPCATEVEGRLPSAIEVVVAEDGNGVLIYEREGEVNEIGWKHVNKSLAFGGRDEV